MEYDGNQPVQTLLREQLEGYSLTSTGDFPRIAIEEIQDRSKSDIISKGIVFIMQYIARGAQGLPIMELELVTIAFAVLNFISVLVVVGQALERAASRSHVQEAGSSRAKHRRTCCDEQCWFLVHPLSFAIRATICNCLWMGRMGTQTAL